MSVAQWLLGRIAAFKARRVRARFRHLTADPRAVQRRRLFSQLKRQRDTDFGRDFGFRSIATVADFRRQLPISTYDDYAPYIEKVKAGHFRAMFADEKVIMFAMTSGTTANRKYIPVPPRFLHEYRQGWLIWGLHMYEDHPQLWFKPMLQITSDWDEFRTSANIPCGSISGLTTHMQWKVVRKTYILPPEAAKIKDICTKYYLGWRLGLQRPLGLMVSANPSTLIHFARFGDENKEILLRDLANGTIDPQFVLPEAVKQVEAKRLSPNPTRAKELETIINQTGGLKPKDVWPTLGFLGNWTGGSVGVYMRDYPTYFGNPSVRDLGLVASEGRMTIPLVNNTPAGILEVTSTYFEFVPVDELDSPQPTVLEAHELEEGQRYYILLTTSSGLYRYNIYDVVRCVGWYQRTPLLEFLNKGSYFSSLTGEKLSEFQVVAAVKSAIEELDLIPRAFALSPHTEETVPYYCLYLEAPDLNSQDAERHFAERIEFHLRRNNSEYAEKRDSLRLGPVRLALLQPGAWSEWDRARLAAKGGTAEQYKHPCLLTQEELQKYPLPRI